MSEPWRTWMPLDIGRYLTNTGHLSTLEHGAYLLLIMHHWTTGALPQDDKKLAAIAKLSPRQWQGIRSTISSFFRPDWSHKTVEEQLRIAEERYQKRARAGHIGGATRALHERERRDHDIATPSASRSPSNASAELEQSSSNATRELQQKEPGAQALTHTTTSSYEELWVSARKRVNAAFLRNHRLAPEMGYIEIWKERGFNASVCASIIEDGLARNPKIRGLKYFDSEISDAHATPQVRPRAGPARQHFTDGRHQVLAEIQEARDEQKRNRSHGPGDSASESNTGLSRRIEHAR